MYGIALWETTFQRQSSAVTYRKALKRFCVEWGLASSDLVRLPLSEIEDLTETFIHRNKRKISPKYLNVIYCAVKSWCQFTRKIKHTSQFRQIKFDKSSRNTRDCAMLTKEIVKRLFDNANLKEKIVLSFYGVNALRPSLIPQILLENFLQSDLKLSAYSAEISEKAWIWVNARVAIVFQHC